ncbi:MAG: hypothetical protein IJ666_06995 [Ruminococcus sp.]|nr:hypothetical protein [Ruminococcus sp.]
MKKSQKGNALSKVIVIIAVLIIIAAVIFFIFGDKFGLGTGFGLSGSGGGNSQSSQQSEDIPAVRVITPSEDAEEITEPSTEEITENAMQIIEITISGSVILKDGEEITADDIISEINAADGDVVVNITDDSAIADTMDALRERLDSVHTAYTIR